MGAQETKVGCRPAAELAGTGPGGPLARRSTQQNDNPTPDPMDTCALGADSTNSPTAQIASQPSCAANTPAGSLRPIRLIVGCHRHWPEVAPRPPAMPACGYLPASVAILRCSAARAVVVGRRLLVLLRRGFCSAQPSTAPSRSSGYWRPPRSSAPSSRVPWPGLGCSSLVVILLRNRLVFRRGLRRGNLGRRSPIHRSRPTHRLVSTSATATALNIVINRFMVILLARSFLHRTRTTAAPLARRRLWRRGHPGNHVLSPCSDGEFSEVSQRSQGKYKSKTHCA